MGACRAAFSFREGRHARGVRRDRFVVSLIVISFTSDCPKRSLQALDTTALVGENANALHGGFAFRYHSAKSGQEETVLFPFSES